MDTASAESTKKERRRHAFVDENQEFLMFRDGPPGSHEFLYERMKEKPVLTLDEIAALHKEVSALYERSQLLADAGDLRRSLRDIRQCLTEESLIIDRLGMEKPVIRDFVPYCAQEYVTYFGFSCVDGILATRLLSRVHDFKQANALLVSRLAQHCYCFAKLTEDEDYMPWGEGLERIEGYSYSLLQNLNYAKSCMLAGKVDDTAQVHDSDIGWLRRWYPISFLDGIEEAMESGDIRPESPLVRASRMFQPYYGPRALRRAPERLPG